LHAPNAHTAGDSIVFFRGSDVISTGDIFITTGYPYIDVENGGTITGIIDALNRIIDLAIPEELQEGGTLIVPGHGRLCDESEVVEYRDMLTIIRSVIQERINEGMSLDEVQATRPTSGFDVRYGSDSGFWTTEQFVAAIYNELRNSGTN
jgi:glyoxylase-like metal-dependent hydrolase (beta-lactamase superfamily II)